MATLTSKTKYANNHERRVLRAEDLEINTFTLNDTTWVEILPDVEYVRHFLSIQFQGDGSQIIEINKEASSTGAIWFNSSQATNELTDMFANYSGTLFAKVKDSGADVDGVTWVGK